MMLRKLKTACIRKFEYTDSIQIKYLIYESENIESPFVAGIIKPIIYLPSGLSDIQLKNVLRHETVHIIRHDILKISVSIFILSLLWFNPIVWAGVSMFRNDMELSCDDSAVNNMSASERCEYARLIVESAVINSKHQPFAFMSDKAYFEMRIKNILKEYEKQSDIKYKTATAFIALICVAAIAAGGIIFVHASNYNDNISWLNLKKAYEKELDQGAVIEIYKEGDKIKSVINENY